MWECELGLCDSAYLHWWAVTTTITSLRDENSLSRWTTVSFWSTTSCVENHERKTVPAHRVCVGIGLPIILSFEEYLWKSSNYEEIPKSGVFLRTHRKVSEKFLIFYGTWNSLLQYPKEPATGESSPDTWLHYPKDAFNFIFPSMLRSFYVVVFAFHVFHACYMPLPSHPPLCGYHYNIRRRVKLLKLHLNFLQPPPAFSFRSKYFT